LEHKRRTGEHNTKLLVGPTLGKNRVVHTETTAS